jgi:acyl-CoA thioesterase-1
MVKSALQDQSVVSAFRRTLGRLKPATTVLILCALSAIAACGTNADRRADSVVQQAPPRTTTSAKPQTRPRIVVLGDSLTAGLGLPIEEAYPSLLQKWVDDDGLRYEVVNAGVSGDTSAGGLSRLDWALEGDVKFLIVALGGNDALRALPVDELRRNLSAIVERAQAKHIQVVLAGMEAPRNFGRDYDVGFHQVYPEVARKYNIQLVPFLLQDVAGIDRLNQRDGIHPTAEGAQIVAKNVWTVLKPLLANPHS